METEFLGHNIKYWVELQKRADELGVTDYLQEIANLRGKLEFCESRVSQMVEVLSVKR